MQNLIEATTPDAARAGGRVCAKIPLQNFYDPNSAGGCGGSAVSVWYALPSACFCERCGRGGKTNVKSAERCRPWGVEFNGGRYRSFYARGVSAGLLSGDQRPAYQSIGSKSAYALAGGLAGLAGILQASRITTGQPNIGVGYELDAIAAVVIGGTSLWWLRQTERGPSLAR